MDPIIGRKYYDPNGKTTLRHEYQHLKNMLYRRVFETGKLEFSLMDYLNEQNPKIRRLALENFFSERRRHALIHVKDEFFAYLIDRRLQQSLEQLSSLFCSQDNGPYDYLFYWREQYKYDSFYQETAKRMLVQEYKEIIQRAANSFAELVRKGKYSIEEAIALLTDKPLEDWPKTIRRLLEQEKIKI